MAVEPLLASRPQKAFISTILLQAVVVLVMVAITFSLVAVQVDFDHPTYKTLPCYLALFALAELFELGMAFDALRLRNIIQLIGILLFHLALMVFAALQVHETHSALVEAQKCAQKWNYVTCDGPGTLWRKVEPLLIVAPCTIALSGIVMLFWIKELYAEFGWAIFHVVGANPKMKTMYQYYQVMICLLKFDFFCFAGVTMQLLIVVLRTSSAEFGVTVAAIPIVLFLLVACGFAVQREIKWLMTVSLVMMLAAMGYFVYKLFRFYSPSSSSRYVTTRATLTVFTIVAFVLLFMTFLIGLRCFYDFDKGLQSSKVNGQSYSPVTLDQKWDLFSGGMGQQPNSSYKGGVPMAPRISIE
jgi:hypothetical protein